MLNNNIVVGNESKVNDKGKGKVTVTSEYKGKVNITSTDKGIGNGNN